jgi:ferric-dicitrate binding protein FerR (iron transport regulator)
MKKMCLLSSLLLLAALTRTPTADSAVSSARISHITGQVQARLGASWGRAGLNQALYPGMTVRTGSASRTEIRYRDGSVIRMGSRTLLRIRAAHDLRLLQGKTWIKKQHDPAQKLKIRTPIAVATVIGTELFVSHNAQEVSHVTTLNGVVEVTGPQGDTRRVNPGEWVEIEPEKPLEVPTKFDWNTLKKQERFMIDLDFTPPPAQIEANDQDWS